MMPQEDKQSNCHRDSVDRIYLESSNINIDESLVKQSVQEKAKNRSALLNIISNIRFLARQGLPLRGADHDKDSNFYQLNNLRCQENTEFEEWLQRKKDKYTSPEIQNEILSIMSDKVIRSLADEIRHSHSFALLADKTTDVSNRQQLVVCIRWIDDGLQAHEHFIGLYKIDNTKASTIAESIKDVVVGLNLSISNCRGQAYDGAKCNGREKIQSASKN